LILPISVCRAVGDFVASRAATADLIAERVCSLGWSISSSAAEALLGLDVLLQAPASSNTRVNAGVWVSAAAVAGSSRDDWASLAENSLVKLYKTRVASELANDAPRGSRDDADVMTHLWLLLAAFG
jgi:hypothetical protein